MAAVQGYLAHKKHPPPLGPPQGPIPTVGSWGGAVSYDQNTPVLVFAQVSLSLSFGESIDYKTSMLIDAGPARGFLFY